MFKLAINAGHYIGTAGKRCGKALDPNETREWWLNDRIVDKIETILAEYDGIEIKRIDDTTGKKDTPLYKRPTVANDWGADFYLSIHHNAGIKRGTGGGIVAYVHTSCSAESLLWQKALYDAAIKATGLKGNRATPLAKKALYEVRKTNMPAVLMECGFMDSATDVPIILTEDFADKCAGAFADVIIERAGLKKKAVAPTPAETVMYRVQVGSYAKKSNATAMLAKLEKKGFDGYVKTATVNGETRYRVQVGAYAKKSNATAMLAKLKSAGFAGYVTTA